MKFSEVPIRSFFRTKYDDCIKISEYKYVSSDNGNDEIFSINPDAEVELITKCENCKYYNSETQRKKIYENHYYCNAEINESNNFLDEHFGSRDVLIRQNPETFSCSLFEMKEG